MSSRHILGTLVAASLAAAGCQTTPPTQHADVRTMAVNGTLLPYAERGRGEPIVLVHGAIADYLAWDARLATLSRSYRTISYRQREPGPEQGLDDASRARLQTHAEDLAAFIRALDVGPVHVLAWSYSGRIAMNVIMRKPELVKSAFVFEPVLPGYLTDRTELQAIGDDEASYVSGVVQALRAGGGGHDAATTGGRSARFAAYAGRPGAGPDTLVALAGGASPQAFLAEASRGCAGDPATVPVVRGADVGVYLDFMAQAAARCSVRNERTAASVRK